MEDVDRLRINSRAKHLILKDYLPAWFSILGTWHKTLNYFDCFAGPGQYKWKDKAVDGSPIISIEACIDLLTSQRDRKPEKINLIFIDDDRKQLDKLERQIQSLENIPKALDIRLIQYNSERFVGDVLSGKDSIEPSFFFIDPYGHPFSLEFMKSILAFGKTEIMVNIMWFRIKMDMNNQQKAELCDKLFSPERCRDVATQVSDHGGVSSQKMIDYLHRRLEARYHIPFRVNYGPDEHVTTNRLKYLLIHYSNNFMAFEHMLRSMWKHSDEGNPLMVQSGQPLIFPLKDVDDLENNIRREYVGTDQRITFEEFQAQNWRWYFVEKHYRNVLKKLERDGIIEIMRITSKRSGLSGRDMLIFKGSSE